jgi:hypothetical protein
VHVSISENLRYEIYVNKYISFLFIYLYMLLSGLVICGDRNSRSKRKYATI